MSASAMTTKGKAWNEFAHREGKAGADFALLLALWRVRQTLINRGILVNMATDIQLTDAGEDVLNRVDGYVMYRTGQP